MTRRRVLLVLNEGPVRDAMVRALQVQGHEVRAVSIDAVEGVAESADVDALLVDAMLPDEAAERLVAAVRARTPVVALADRVVDGALAPRPVWAERIVRRPFDLELLRELLRG